MILSHKHGFIFVKTGKTGGTSVEVFLSQFCGEEDVVTPIHPSVSGHRPRNYQGLFNPSREIICALVHKDETFLHLKRTFAHLKSRVRFRPHMPAWIVRSRVSTETWNSYFKFTVERNPWDKVVSAFHFRKNQEWCRDWRDITFDEFIRRREFPSDYHRYADCREENVIVDQIMKYEQLGQELESVLEVLGINPADYAETVPFSDIRAKGAYRAHRRPFQREYSSAHQREVVRDEFKKEIDLLSYSFFDEDPNVKPK